MTYVESGTILDTILSRTINDVEERKSARPLAELEHIADQRPATVSLFQALAQPGMAVIAEIKRASPSRGRFAAAVEPESVAAEYIAGGAAAISVLTDAPFFQGSLQDMALAASVAHGAEPAAAILRKDFIVDPYQIVEARAFGADAILLIVSALDDAALMHLFATAAKWGLDALIEVHDEEEMARAVAAGGRILGVNNRDLRTFTVDLATTERLAPLAPADAVVVAESGVFRPQDVKRMADAGADAVLVGESLVTAPDRSAAVRALLAPPE